MRHFLTILFYSCLVVIGCWTTALSQSQPQDFNLTSVGQLSYQQELNDIWGYVDEFTTEYALVGTRTGTSIVGLANPANPIELLFIPGATSVWRDLKTWGDYAYVTTDQGKDGLLIIDLSPLPQGTPTYIYWRPELTVNGVTDTLDKAHNLYIDENGYCYIAGSNINNGETFILDVHTTPGTPIMMGSTLPVYAHDAYTRGDTLWTSDINDGTFSVYDVSNKNAPVFLANQTTPRNFAHNAWISDNGNSLFTTDEKANAWIGSYDVSDLSNIQELDRWRTPNSNTIPHNTHTFNDYLVISYYTDGLIILDATRPDNLIEVARYDTYYGTPSTGFYGAWGAYPYLPSGLILVSDINTGLHILQATYQRAAWLEGAVTDQSTGANLFDVSVKILGTFDEDQTDLNGDYKTGNGLGGTYQVEYKKVGYVPQTINVTLTNGQVTVQNVQLVPAVAFQLTGQVIDSLSNNPIPNAKLKFQSSLYQYTATADASGNFSISIMPDNDYTAIAGQWGHNAKAFDFVALDAATTPAQVYDLIRGYKDEFVLDYGWTEFGSATTGRWERGIPDPIFTWQGSVLPPEGDLEGDIGDYCLITGNNGNGTHGADDVDNGFTTIVSPVMDLSTASNPKLRFNYFLAVNWPPNSANTFKAYVTNGTDTATLFSTATPNYEWSGVQEFRLLNYINLSSNMRVYFEGKDSSGTTFEALVDLFEIRDSLSTNITTIASTPAGSLAAMPNPFANSVQLDYTWPQQQDLPVLRVFNALGQAVEQRQLPAYEGSLQIGQNWDTGVYFIQLGERSLKIIKQD